RGFFFLDISIYQCCERGPDRSRGQAVVTGSLRVRHRGRDRTSLDQVALHLLPSRHLDALQEIKEALHTELTHPVMREADGRQRRTDSISELLLIVVADQ